jgi:uncharacterized membrane protein
MASVAASFEVPRVRVGRVLQRAGDTVRHQPALTITLSVVLGAVPVVAFLILLAGVDRAALVLTVADRRLPSSFAIFVLELFFSFAISVLVQGAMIVPVLAEAAGNRAKFGETLRSSLRALPALVGLGLLTGLAVVIGATLLIVPGMIVWLLWSIAPSAVAAEREGVFMALNRSQELTQGARWKVFAILMMLEGMNLALGIVTLLIANWVLGIALRPEASVEYVLIMGLLNTVSCLMWATVQAALYVELVRAKEGGSPEKLAEVFA